MSNYSYEDDIRAGLDRAKAEAQCAIDDMPREFSRYAESVAKLADALERVKCPDDAIDISEAIVDLTLLIRRLARSWQKAIKLVEEVE